MAQPAKRVSGGGIGRVLIQIGVVLVIVGVGYAGYAWWTKRAAASAPGAGGSGSQAGVAPPPMQVRVVEVRGRDVPLAPTYLGRTEASTTVEIRARVSGFLEERAFEEGSLVRAGDLLYRIDPRPFEAALAAAKAQVANAQARQAGAQRQVDRLTEAARTHAASEAEVDQIRTQAQAAEADVRSGEAAVTQAELNLSYTRIVAPSAGVMGRSLKDVGSYVTAGQEGLLAVLQQTDPIYVTFSLSERELVQWQRMIATGEVSVPRREEIPVVLQLTDNSFHRLMGLDPVDERPATATGSGPSARPAHRTSGASETGAGSAPQVAGSAAASGSVSGAGSAGEPIVGHINFIDSRIDPSSGTTLVRAIVPNPERTLRPGQLVKVTTRGISRRNAFMVPQGAVMQSPAGATVYVAAGEGAAQRAEARSVQLGEWHENAWIITSGLKDGDRVIVERTMSIRPGAPVQAVIDRGGASTSAPTGSPAGSAQSTPSAR